VIYQRKTGTICKTGKHNLINKTFCLFNLKETKCPKKEQEQYRKDIFQNILKRFVFNY
jgi:hypothetical protein